MTQLEVIVREPRPGEHATPVLFLHGMWHGAWCWVEHFLLYFAGHGYTAYAMSFRGHGASEGQERLRWTPLAEYVSDLQQGIEQIGEPPLLVAHSMGGMVVQRYLKAHRARGAVLLAAVPPHGLLPTSLHLFGRHPLAFLQAVLACSPYKVVGTPSLCQEFLFSPDLPEEQLAAYFARIQDESFRAYLDMLLPDLARPGRVETPILVLGAANDRAISPREVEATARALGVKPEFFPGMAHDVMLETDWQAVADRILGWFSEQGVTT